MELLELDDLRRDTIACFSGPVVYFLFSGAELVYIGCTLNFLGRIGSHAAGLKRKEFDSFKVVRVPEDVAPIQLERLYIKKYRPKLNTTSSRDDDIDEFGLKAMDRALIRVRKGESIEQAAAAENLLLGAVRARCERARRQDEKDKFLFSYLTPGQTEESIRSNRDANIGIYSPGGRRRPKETEALK
jgi:hypothetical protein